jgi:hypothetical protein
VRDHVIREHNREVRLWLLRDSWVRRGGSKDPELMKHKRRFNGVNQHFRKAYIFVTDIR